MTKGKEYDMLYRQYDEDILSKIKKTEKEILNKFISICAKHNLKYFVVFGTLLGTIRHAGFIPWDDDIDVGMLREDYEKFLKVAQKECGQNFFLQTVETDSKYHLYFAKLRKTDTIFIEDSLQKADSTSGFYIDIFPFDMIPDNDTLMKKQVKKAVFLGMLLSINRVREPQIGRYAKGKEILLKSIWALVHGGMKVLGIKGISIDRLLKDVSTKNNGRDYGRYITFAAEAEKWIILKEELEDLVEMPFEDIFVKVPKGYHSILRRCYGNYLELPPKEKRVNHMPVEIKFPGEKQVIVLKGKK